MRLSVYQKYLFLQGKYIEEGLGGIFSPETATKFYGVSFFCDGGLKMNKHYKILPTISINGMGAQAALEVYFTDKGIKKLLKTNDKMRKEVHSLYEECQEEFNLPKLEDEV